VILPGLLSATAVFERHTLAACCGAEAELLDVLVQYRGDQEAARRLFQRALAPTKSARAYERAHGYQAAAFCV
jgi:hypothetical protein